MSETLSCFSQPESITNTEYAVGGIVFSGSQISAEVLKTSGAGVLAYLPYFGFLHGLMNVMKGAISLGTNVLYSEQEGYYKYSRYFKELLYIGSGTQLIINSVESLKRGGASSYALGPLYVGFAITAGIDLAIAIWECIEIYTKANAVEKANATSQSDYHLPRSVEHQKTDALMNVFAKAASFSGWMAIASGFPIGWLFIAASSLYNLYENRSILSCGQFGRYSATSGNSHGSRAEPAEKVYTRSLM